MAVMAEELGQTLRVWEHGISKGIRGTVHAMGVGTRVTPHLTTVVIGKLEWLCVHAYLYMERNPLSVLNFFFFLPLKALLCSDGFTSFNRFSGVLSLRLKAKL